MANQNQTAVQWLESILNKQGFASVLTDEEIQQAEEMEKKQHDNTWVDSRIEYNGDDYIGQGKTFEQYYNETFNK